MMNEHDETTHQPLVDKLMAIEERWDEACAGTESSALREWHKAHVERQARDLGNRSELPLTRKELSVCINEIDS